MLCMSGVCKQKRKRNIFVALDNIIITWFNNFEECSKWLKPHWKCSRFVRNKLTLMHHKEYNISSVFLFVFFFSFFLFFVCIVVSTCNNEPYVVTLESWLATTWAASNNVKLNKYKERKMKLKKEKKSTNEKWNILHQITNTNL